MSDFVMPSLGADMEAGTVLEWYVKPGDTVKRGDIVALVDTSKAEIEVEIFEGGVIDELLVPVGERVPVGTVLATLHPVGAEVTGTGWSARSTDAGTASSTDRGHRATHAAAGTRPGRGGAGRNEPPAARVPPGPAVPRSNSESISRRSREPDRTAQSPRRTSSARARGPSHRRRSNGRRGDRTRAGDRQAAMREAIGALMARSKREIPHYYLQLEIDMGRAVDWLRDANLQRTVNERLLPSALLLSAVPDRRRDARDERLLDQTGRSDPATASTWAWRSRCAAAA